MNLLIIDFESSNSNPVSEWYKDHNCYLITSIESLRLMSNEVISSFKKVVGIESLHPDNDDLIFYHAEKLRKETVFDYVIGVREFDLLPAAYIRDKWGLSGASVEAIEAYRDKGVMKKILERNNVSIPKFSLIKNALDVIKFIEENDYPVILKPRTSKRARGISILKNDNDLHNSLYIGLKKNSEELINMMVEEFVDSPMYHVDGVVLNNQIRFIWPSLYVSNCMDFQDGNYISSCLLLPEDKLFDRIIKYVRKCIGALPSPVNFAFHAEVFLCSDGSFKLCEIAARAGGGPVMTAIENIFGINPQEIAFNAYIGNVSNEQLDSINIRPSSIYGWIIIPNKLTNSYIYNIPESCPYPQVTSYKTFAKDGDYFSDERQVIAEITITSSTSNEVKNLIAEIMEWFYSQINFKAVN
ncbi:MULTISPECIES: ATP-grasp domain-containing protein [unclassified Photorhabdus]|uniref:ATP-grasp domain-containing protein n=1 Tax=unclassified Photorhabdus TaxID=2620880 RepID=UPI000DCDC219|nr:MULTISPECIES: ATP-grasp domain-containing protein [unclassified Photorhabdus]RAX02638.1 hypothetical protein CKY03_03540 [Photorhabdus sp. S9-53]RAX02877.1 hypothetical protein CKY05_03550 [Photorhabdus sp. S10-54]RAX05616.1 hypothetical protein CKY04_03545 [Photorhabdus sp. S8-52]